MSTVAKLVKGSAWNMASQVGSQAFNMVFTIIMARLLTPDDFGLFGMVVIVIAFIGYFSEFGMTAVLIQKRDIDELDTNSMFWTSVAFSAILYAITFAGAPLIAAFYKEPRLTLITRVVFSNFLVNTLSFIPATMQTKKLEYGILTISDMIAVVVSGLVAIILAFMGFGVWSLVWQTISLTAARGVALVILTGWRPKPLFSWKRVKALLGAGVDFTVNNLLQFAFDNTDYLLVGKLLGKGPLGIYTMAFRLSKAPILKIEQVFGKMLFPAFASFNDDQDRIRHSFTRLLVFSLTWLMPVLIYGYFAAEPLIHILLGSKWNQAVPLIRVFMLYLIVNAFCIQNYAILLSLNKIRTWNAVQLASTVALALAGFVGIKLYGIMGMAIAFTAITTLSLISVFAITAARLNVSFRGVLKSIGLVLLKNLLILAALLGAVFLTRIWTLNDWALVIFPGIAFAIAFAALNAAGIKKALSLAREKLSQRRAAGTAAPEEEK